MGIATDVEKAIKDGEQKGLDNAGLFTAASYQKLVDMGLIKPRGYCLMTLGERMQEAMRKGF